MMHRLTCRQESHIVARPCLIIVLLGHDRLERLDKFLESDATFRCMLSSPCNLAYSLLLHSAWAEEVPGPSNRAHKADLRNLAKRVGPEAEEDTPKRLQLLFCEAHVEYHLPFCFPLGHLHLLGEALE